MRLLFLILLLLPSSLSLTGQQSLNFCHCDLTRSFCDFNCCCDTDCSTAITSACFNAQSNSYCPDPTFFARLGSGFLNAQGCFYYNSSSDVVDEVSLTSQQIDTIVNQQSNFSRLASSLASVKTGFQIGDVLTLGSLTTFNFLQSNGDCLVSAGTAGTFQLKFGVSMKLSCNGVVGTPLLYSQFSGQTLFQFTQDTTSTVTIPTFASATITNADIRIIVGHYGSDKSRYIERVTVSTSTVVATERTLNVWFVEPSQLEEAGRPSFFPQLPSDMFYPVYLLS